MARWTEDDGLLEQCLVCDGSQDFYETDEERGFEGVRVVVCTACNSIYDAETGDLLDEGEP